MKTVVGRTRAFAQRRRERNRLARVRSRFLRRRKRREEDGRVGVHHVARPELVRRATLPARRRLARFPSESCAARRRRSAQMPRRRRSQRGRQRAPSLEELLRAGSLPAATSAIQSGSMKMRWRGPSRSLAIPAAFATARASGRNGDGEQRKRSDRGPTACERERPERCECDEARRGRRRSPPAAPPSACSVRRTS